MHHYENGITRNCTCTRTNTRQRISAAANFCVDCGNNFVTPNRDISHLYEDIENFRQISTLLPRNEVENLSQRLSSLRLSEVNRPAYRGHISRSQSLDPTLNIERSNLARSSINLSLDQDISIDVNLPPFERSNSEPASVFNSTLSTDQSAISEGGLERFESRLAANMQNMQ